MYANPQQEVKSIALPEFKTIVSTKDGNSFYLAPDSVNEIHLRYETELDEAQIAYRMSNDTLYIDNASTSNSFTVHYTDLQTLAADNNCHIITSNLHASIFNCILTNGSYIEIHDYKVDTFNIDANSAVINIANSQIGTLTGKMQNSILNITGKPPVVWKIETDKVSNYVIRKQ